MKIQDHRAKITEYPVLYQSVNFVKDPETGEKVRNSHGQFETRPVEEVHHSKSVTFTWMVLVDGENANMSTAQAVNAFGKKTWRHALRDYKQRLRASKLTGERKEQYLAHVNFERTKRGQVVLDG